MAKAKFIDDPDFEKVLKKANENFSKVAESAIRAGAGIVADEMRLELRKAIKNKQATELLGALGITPVKQDKNGNYSAHVGFDGYQMPGYGTNASRGTPFQIIARVMESGAVQGGRYRVVGGKRRTVPKASWIYRRKGTHFASKAVRASAARRNEAMTKAAERELTGITTETT